MTDETNTEALEIEEETKVNTGKTRGRPKKAKQLQNVHRGPVAIHGHLWTPGETREVDSDTHGQKRVQNAIKNGILKEV